jgi:alkanesulfonate monooxygenase SsuD/methylene tetrahydromethanopterin reductase-like flavin-dependent oxidoreductase (luciferase family)
MHPFASPERDSRRAGYFLVRQAREPDLDPSRGRREQSGGNQHVAFIDGLSEDGQIPLGGPIGDVDGEHVVLVPQAGSEDEVRAMFADDPWMDSGAQDLGLSGVALRAEGADPTSATIPDRRGSFPDDRSGSLIRNRIGSYHRAARGLHSRAMTSRQREFRIEKMRKEADMSTKTMTIDDKPVHKIMRSGLFVPLFDELADPALVARLAAEAEQAGWDGVFVWDHVSWREPVVDVADPQITLAAIATSTERIRLGPMVTPLARRRPVKVARETATLDRLSGGRLTLGVGLGSDEFGGEYSITGEELDDRRRARMLDESLGILHAAWSGEPVRHLGEHYTIAGMRFLPRPVQRPGVPVWVAGFYGKSNPLRRAARHDGFFPVNLQHPDQLAEIISDLTVLRAESGKAREPYDVVAALPPGTDPNPYAAAGATWWLVEFPWDAVSVDQVRGVIHDGPAPP